MEFKCPKDVNTLLHAFVLVCTMSCPFQSTRRADDKQTLCTVQSTTVCSTASISFSLAEILRLFSFVDLSQASNPTATVDKDDND